VDKDTLAGFDRLCQSYRSPDDRLCVGPSSKGVWSRLDLSGCSRPVARSQPAGSYCDAGPIAHADAEATNANAFTHPIDQYAGCVRDCDININRDPVSHSHIDSYTDTDTHGHPYAYPDSDPEAADCDSLSNAYSTPDHRAGGKVGSIREG
jgi:hypothetical protein